MRDRTMHSAENDAPVAGCCSCCRGFGSDYSCAGMCWDCHGTGCAHPDPCVLPVWDDSAAPGGYVCPKCGWPSESEPCEHIARILPPEVSPS